MTTLTPRQLEILRLSAEGLTCYEIGKKLFIGEQTARTHRQAIRARMGAATLPHAIALAYEQGILESRQLDSARAWAVALEQEVDHLQHEVMAHQVSDGYEKGHEHGLAVAAQYKAERDALSALLRGMARRVGQWREKSDYYQEAAQELERAMDCSDAELQFIAARYLADGSGANFRADRCTGISSDALAHYGVRQRPVPAAHEYPRDESDLAACERTYDMAPLHVQKRMLPVLTLYREAVAKVAS